MSKIVINRATFRDKVMGCWLGKNAGGTLGEPVEGKFGQDEMFHLDWYSALPEGGIPNDDLELQLIWLQLLLQKGPQLKTSDFVEAWTDCIAYNFDEYGLAKANMQLGLLPPVCGWHNNAFKDCMGSPIRSEIWACLFPGAPEQAAHYAFMDAIVDHGGGESVYGERFNTVLQSAAFVNDDKFELLELALSAIPKDCLTYKCVRASIDNFNAGMTYVDNRNDLKDRFYNPVAQYSPLNLGFQTIGWLYGDGFGDSICKAVNCGWDTDCTAATLGALLGIIGGASSLPEKWIQPLGLKIATNMTTGGIRNLIVPTDIIELTNIVCAEAEKMAAFWGCNTVFSDSEVMTTGRSLDSPCLGELVGYRPNELKYEFGSVDVNVIYHTDAALKATRDNLVSLRIENHHPICKNITVNVFAPKDISVEIKEPTSFSIEANGEVSLDMHVNASFNAIHQSNRLFINVQVDAEPALPPVPIVLEGSNRWLVSELFEGKKLDEDTGIQENVVFEEKPSQFFESENSGNRLEICSEWTTNGVVYLLHDILSAEEKDVVLGVPNTGFMKLFLNGKEIHRTRHKTKLRANLGNGGALGDLSNYVVTKLNKGWNQILIKMEVVDQAIDAHFTIGGMSTVCYKNHGMPVLNIERTQFIWEEK